MIIANYSAAREGDGFKPLSLTNSANTKCCFRFQISIISIVRSKVDDVFFVVFPIMFLVFNLIYWPMCLSSRHGPESE